MAHQRDLGFLMRGLDQGAIPGPAGLEMLMALRDRHRQEAQERQAMQAQQQQETMGGLSGLITQGAQEGTPLDQLLPQLQSLAGLQGGLQPQMMGGLQGLIDQSYLPFGQTGFVGNAGQSRIAPQLRPGDAADIAQMISEGATRDDAHQEMQRIYGPNTYARLVPQIDEVIKNAYGMAQSRFRAGFPMAPLSAP